MLIREDMFPTRRSLEEWPFAVRSQAITGLKADPLGRTWVLAGTEDLKTSRLDVYDADGNYLGHCGDCALPAAFDREGRVFLESQNDDGLPLYHLAVLR